LARLVGVGEIVFGNGRRCRLYSATSAGVRWLGWSTNLQSSWGVTTEFKQRLGAWLAGTIKAAPVRGASPGTAAGADVDEGGHLSRGLRVAGKAALAEVLRTWLDQSQAPTIGDIGAFGGRAWLWIDLGVHRVALNADTKRAAVAAFLRDSATNPQRPWRVIANARGRVNKVLPNPDAAPLPGWYAYLTRPLSRPGRI
jgi:hypothetical protein